jgi:uncharacterized membrane protein YkoI
MTRMLRLSLTALLVLGATAPARAIEPRQDHNTLLNGVERGRVLSLRQIESRVLPRMGDADYLGPEYDTEALVYRLKFLRSGRVFWVDVDARTGDVIGRSGR